MHIANIFTSYLFCVCLCLSKLFCAQMYNIYLRYVVVILVISTLLSVNTVRPFSVILAHMTIVQ